MVRRDDRDTGKNDGDDAKPGLQSSDSGDDAEESRGSKEKHLAEVPDLESVGEKRTNCSCRFFPDGIFPNR